MDDFEPFKVQPFISKFLGTWTESLHAIQFLFRQNISQAYKTSKIAGQLLNWVTYLLIIYPLVGVLISKETV